MSVDPYPFSLLWWRLFDLVVFVISIAIVFYIVLDISFLGYFTHSEIQKMSLVTAIIGIYTEYRQKSFYDKGCAHEQSLLGGGLTTDTKILEFIAKTRSYLAQNNVLIIIFGMIISVFYA